MNSHDIVDSHTTVLKNGASTSKAATSKSYKRTHDDSDSEKDESASAAKLPKIDNDTNEHRLPEADKSSLASCPSLLTLSDDVLLHIFGYLDSVTLTRLNRTCQRLKNICSDSTLWTRFDTDGLPLTVKELRTMLKYFSKRTTSITVHGFLKVRSKMHHESITKATLDNISDRCSNLEELRLEGCFIDAQNGL